MSRHGCGRPASAGVGPDKPKGLHPTRASVNLRHQTSVLLFSHLQDDSQRLHEAEVGCRAGGGLQHHFQLLRVIPLKAGARIPSRDESKPSRSVNITLRCGNTDRLGKRSPWLPLPGRSIPPEPSPPLRPSPACSTPRPRGPAPCPPGLWVPRSPPSTFVQSLFLLCLPLQKARNGEGALMRSTKPGLLMPWRTDFIS